MEYILDAGKAVTCFNLINKDSPCMNVYCQNCITSFMEEKHTFDDTEDKQEDPKKAVSVNPEETEK
mgnify:CR=1 FL=1